MLLGIKMAFYLYFLMLIIIAYGETGAKEPEKINETLGYSGTSHTTIELMSTTKHQEEKDIKTDSIKKKTYKATTAMSTEHGLFTTLPYQRQQTSETEVAFNTENPEYNPGIMVLGKNGTFKEDTCSEFGECVDETYWYCRCDKLCEFYHDCCTNYTYNVTSYGKPTMKCVGVSGGSIDELWGVYMISTCPSGYTNSRTINGCLGDSLRENGPPVIDAENLTLYRNKYCAVCNNVTDSVSLNVTLYPRLAREGQQWMLNFTTTELKDVLMETILYRIHIPRNIDVRYCIKNLITDYDATCKTYINPVFNRKQTKLYRNSFCTSNLDLQRESCLGGFFNGVLPKPATDTSTSPRMSVLFSFTSIERQSKDQCEIWSQKTQNLHVCSNLPLFTNVQLEVEYGITVPENSTQRELIQIGLFSVVTKSIVGLTEMVGDVTMEINNNTTLMKITCTCKILKTMFGHEIRSILHRLKNQQAVLTIAGVDTSRSVYKYGKQVPDSSYKVFHSTVKPLGIYDIQFFLRQYDVHVQIPEFTEICSDAEIFANRIGNDTLVINSIKCHEIRHPSNIGPAVLSILTYSLCSCSSLALIMLIAVNRKLRLHVDIPISNLENLSFALVFANICFMVRGQATTGSSWICRATSVTLHYLFLAVFSFASMAVIYIVTTLFQIKARNVIHNGSSFKRRTIITVIGLCIPFPFVAPGLLVDRFGPPYFSPGYRNNDCFPTQFPGNFIFFTGPVMASIIINMSCLVYLVVKIHTTKLSNGTVQRLSIYSEAKIFLRILVLTGLSWVTGIIAAYLESEWMEYVFTILCGSQGILIAVAYMTSKRLSCQRHKASSETHT